jgi:gliding motility-associated-like protein
MFKRIIIILGLCTLLFEPKDVLGCSPINVPTLVSQNINGMNLELMWSSNTTYNCTYYIDVEIMCASQPFSGNPPFYQSATINKTSTPFPYPMQAINMNLLCPGVTYNFRAREVSSTSSATFSSWTATFTFTVPGVPVAFTTAASGNPTIICIPQTSTLNAVPNGGCGPYSYTWTPTATLSNPNIQNPVASPTVTTTYTVTATALCSQQTATSTVTIQVTSPPNPGVASLAPSTICAGQTVTLTLNGQTGTIQWQFGPTTGGPWTNIVGGTTTPFTTGAINSNTCFRAEVTGCGVVTSNVVCVTVNPAPPANAGANAAFCIGGSTQLNASGGGTYSWAPVTTLSNPNIANPFANPTSTTTYTVTVTNNGCTASSSVTITVNPLPVPCFTAPDTVGCLPLSVSFTNCTVNAGSCVWNYGDGSLPVNVCNPPTYIYSTPGTYTVTLTVTDGNGCVNTSTHPGMITANPLPVSCFTSGPQPTTILEPKINFSDCSIGSITSFYWEFGDALNSTSNQQSPQFIYEDTGTYVVKQVVCTGAGCCDSSSQYVIISDFYRLYIPNAFTPNNDGYNSLFMPKGDGLDETTYSFMIFDRWGDLVFKTEKWGTGWDGKANGGSKIAQEDVYVWKITVKDKLGRDHNFTGHVSLIK